MSAITSPPLSARDQATASASTPDTGPYRWLGWLLAVVAVFTVVTAVRSHQVDIPFRDPGGRIFLSRIALSLALLIVLSLLDAAMRVGRRNWTVRNTAAMLQSRWPADRVLVAVGGLLTYHFAYACYRNLKSWVAFNGGHDDRLLSLDRNLFFGHSPAVLLHDLFGRQVAPHVIGVIYESFSVIVPISFVAALVFADRIRDGFVFLSSAIWVWILGVASYYLIPTLGPFASAPKEFAGLDPTSITATQAKYMAERAQLLDHPAAADSFASISAFVSLHVGFTFMILLMLRYYGFTWAVRVMYVYLLAVMVSTVYLGWHFVIDIPGGLLVAYLAVRLGRLTTYPHGRGSP
ncbi:phosphatase PAP2 family protein [Aeromicrobium sp.]|uniref:phosphatase PAP2 family protein n=1 Tax=Aeromicrobium sp. TaxID=1871063 RepID=UPI0019A7CBAA|nr:phosphatase PAP2 family protein [Aeromicrobium sp.]MBC7631582.1 inositol phosphorylceramide synthase [Aeromicrobium sp.]